jgi:hypothetical protein
MELRTRTHTIEENEQHKSQYLKPGANSSTRATLGTRHRTKTSKTKTQHRKPKDEQYGPHRKTRGKDPCTYEASAVRVSYKTAVLLIL